MKHVSRTIIASALLSLATISTASAAAPIAAPALYNIHVHITRGGNSDGKVTLVADANLAATDGKAAPFKLVHDTTYIASVTSTVDAKGKKIGEKKDRSKVATGVDMSVTPTTMPDGKVNVTYAINLSTLVAMRSFTVNGDTIQLPTIDQRSSRSSGVIGTGSSLVTVVGDDTVTITVNKA